MVDNLYANHASSITFHLHGYVFLSLRTDWVQAKTLRAADTCHLGICVWPSAFRGALCRFTYVHVGPSEASQWWMPPWGAGECTSTWQKSGQHTRGGEVLSVSVFDVGILLLEYECGVPKSTAVTVIICFLGPTCKCHSSSACSPGAPGWVPLALEEVSHPGRGCSVLVEVPTVLLFSQRFLNAEAFLETPLV